MTKFGWLVVLGIIIVLGCIGGSVYLVSQQSNRHTTATPDPNQQIEVILPPSSYTESMGTELPEEATSSATTTIR